MDFFRSESPLKLGLSVAVLFLLLRCAFDGVFLATLGFPQGYQPLWRSDLWWAEIINAILMGYVPAALVALGRAIERDLTSLGPALPEGGDSIEAVRNAVLGSPGIAVRAFQLLGVISGLVIVYVDPSFSLGTEPSLSNPLFLWSLLRTPVFTCLVFTLIASDFNTTRAYLHMGRYLVKVDLLDIPALAPFARRGLRSALMWVLFSIIFSLFWLGDAASQQNLALLIIVLTMATAAFVVPLIGVRNNIRSEKHRELNRLREGIRAERETVMGEVEAELRASPRLANLIAYYQLVEQVPEWPINAASLLRFVMYLLIGLGSWLGSAVVERLLDSSLGA